MKVLAYLTSVAALALTSFMFTSCNSCWDPCCDPCCKPVCCPKPCPPLPLSCPKPDCPPAPCPPVVDEGCHVPGY